MHRRADRWRLFLLQIRCRQRISRAAGSSLSRQIEAAHSARCGLHMQFSSLTKGPTDTPVSRGQSDLSRDACSRHSTRGGTLSSAAQRGPPCWVLGRLGACCGNSLRVASVDSERAIEAERPAAGLQAARRSRHGLTTALNCTRSETHPEIHKAVHLLLHHPCDPTPFRTLNTFCLSPHCCLSPHIRIFVPLLFRTSFLA